MSSDIAAGRSSRRIMIVAAAALAVAMMLAVPLFVSVDSDADFTKDEAGYCVELTDPTDTDLSSVQLSSKELLIRSSLYSATIMFNSAGIGTPTISTESFKVLDAKSEKVDSNKKTEYTVKEISAKDVKIVYTVPLGGNLMNTDTTYFTKEAKAAYDAIKAEFGDTVSAGDTLTFTGKIDSRVARSTETQCKLLDDNKCILAGTCDTNYTVSNIDITVTLKHGTDEKQIKYESGVKGVFTNENKVEYQGDTIEVGTKYTVKNTISTSYKGDLYFTVADKDYSLISEETPEPDYEGTVDSDDISEQSSIAVSPALKLKIETLPASTDNVKVDKTYDAAQSAFDDVMMDAVGKDVLKLLLIIGGVILGVIVLIIILVIVLLHMRKKKRQQ